ncbi:hypothetical protein PF010_g18787 [Phytophthora fragariae]|uniref:Centrosomal protein of 290kDa coiled-coil region domain-containing protein n=1 Tax=Phytophthora fragariae TaxID=53985 RepID=A0A6G0KK29_9STRA|nr:hypothetical protein PF010_g18787 [Phytophthora fragariae]
MATQGDAESAALREELELLRGDLLELEGENEQLHELLATQQADASARDLQTQKTLQQKDEQIVRLNETVAGLTTQLQETLDKLQSDAAADAEKGVEPSQEKPNGRAFEQEFEALKTQNEALETKLKELQAQLEREATAGLTAQRQVAQVAEESEDKRSELYSALKENELLRDEALEMQKAVGKMTELVKEYQASMQSMNDQLEAYRDAVDEQTLEIRQLHTKVEQLEQEKVSVEAKLIEMDERESDVDALMNDAKAKFEMEKAVLIAELDDMRRKMKQQQMLHEQQQQQFQENKKALQEEEEESTVRGSASVAMEDMEKQLEMLQELRIRDKSTILELNQRILQQQSDLESLAEHLNVESVVESAVQAALQTQKSRLEGVEQENATVKRRLKEQRELVQDLELRQGIVEKQLVEAEDWNAKYEQQAGLEDVVKYQKKLRAQLEQQQQMNIKLRQELNEQVDAAGKLHVAYERLKAEVGKPAAFEYDDLAIADHLKGQLAINEAVMKQMETQIHELEAERLRFLQKLRDQARLTGHKLYEHHGLTTEQWGVVEEFIDRVKHTPEVAKRLLQTDRDFMTACEDVEKSTRLAKNQQDAIEELERKLDIRSEENALLLKDIEHLHNELDVAHSKPISPTITEPVNIPEDGRGELLRALESAKSKSQRQEGVIYHLRAEIASLRKEREHKSGKKDVVEVSGNATGSQVGTLGAAQDKMVVELHTRAYAETQTSPRMTKEEAVVHLQTQACSDDEDGDISLSDEGIATVQKSQIAPAAQTQQSATECLPMQSPSDANCKPDKQQCVMDELLKKYNALSETYAEMHAKYLEMYDLPAQLSRTQHSLMVLQAEKHARTGAGSNEGGDPVILQDRIDQLEIELRVQIDRVKELEELKRNDLFVNDELVQSSALKGGSGDDNELRNENTLLYERINEVEQLYESLALECTKYKDIASLAASQANVLTKRAAQDQGNREQQEEQLRDLMASSEDHAIVGELQHQLMEIKSTYQQFLVQYDLVTETQQQTLLKNQRLELEMEKKSQELSAVRERTSDKAQILENAIAQVKQRDWTARNTKWDAFRKRLDALEDEMLVEQQRRKQLEKDLEDKQAQLPLLELKQQRGNQSELEAATMVTGSKEKATRLQAELSEIKILNEDLMRQVGAIQTRVSELLRLNGELDSEKRDLRCKYEDLELELQYVRSGYTGGEKRASDNQRESERGSTGSHSPLMRQKVGLYEKDQAELQQAAQATIASLKQLVEEKNTLINEYQRKLSVVRASSAQGKAQDRLENTQLNKKLYEENQRMIGQLKEAMSTISSMEWSGKSKQALQAAQERHDHVLQEWKQAEVALESAKQSIRELQMEREVLRNERDLAEARAGEALEEIVLLKDKNAECEKRTQKLEHQIAFVKRDTAKKEEKLKLLRDAIIKLKEEFLKAEDRHAVEIAKAQHAMNQDFSSRKRKEKERREEEEDEWREEKTRLQSQVQMLQEKLALLKKKHDQQQRRKKKLENEEKEEKESSSEADVQILKEEVERLKRLLKEKVVSEARGVEELEKKVKLLQAQNFALREAATHAAPAPPNVADEKTTREKLDGERKLQRRVDILMLRLKEKQADATSKDSELERCNERISKLESELQLQQARHEKERLTQTNAAPTVTSIPIKQQLDELEHQNAFLQETLALKRKEWEESFTAQMEKYEAQLQRLRRRLVQHGISSNDDDIDDDDTDDTKGQGPNSRLQREEQRFLIGQEVREELIALGGELRSKEQEMVAKDTKLLELELEVESLRLEYRRLQRKNQHSGGSSSIDDTPKQRRTAKGGRGSSWATQERLELEEVVENMKKVIEKLRTENEKLKKTAAKQMLVSPERVDAMRRKLKEQKDARERMEGQLEKLHQENSELKRDKLKLQQKLRTKTASSTKSESNTLEIQLQDKDRQLLKGEQELAELRHQVLQLELQIEHSAHDVNAEENEQIGHEQEEHIKELQAQVLELEDENTKLTNELAAFDEDFFEEIEDLKYKYAQAVRDKRQLEKRLAGGASPASTSSRHSKRS